MASADAELQRYLRDLPRRLRERLKKKLREQAERVADAQRAAASQHAKSGATVESIRVESGRDDLAVVIKAGGPLTTKAVGERTYRRQINIGAGEDTQNVPRGNASVVYDYALGEEFGNSHMSPIPFFYPPWEALRDDVEAELNNEAGEALSD
jgi:hypothetical protein